VRSPRPGLLLVLGLPHATIPGIDTCKWAGPCEACPTRAICTSRAINVILTDVPYRSPSRFRFKNVAQRWAPVRNEVTGEQSVTDTERRSALGPGSAPARASTEPQPARLSAAITARPKPTLRTVDCMSTLRNDPSLRSRPVTARGAGLIGQGARFDRFSLLRMARDVRTCAPGA